MRTLATTKKASWEQARRGLDFSDDLARKEWFHSFLLPDGTHIDGHLSLQELERRVALMPVPANLAGKRVLDIGAWDGWFSFAMERRGAAVTAIDCAAVNNFRKMHSVFASHVDYRIADIQDISHQELGRFDIVLFLSVLYHLKHPLLGLERVCALTTDVAVISSFISDDYTRPVAALLDEVPQLDFFETDELGGQLDNWFGPNVACLMAMCRAAGFARVELIEISGPSATVACYRHWTPPPPQARPGVRLVAAIHTRNLGINFRSAGAEEQISCWFECDDPVTGREQVLPEVDGLGVPCLYLGSRAGNVWQCNFRLPPGLDRGWHAVGIRVGDSLPSETRSIAVDVPFIVDSLIIDSACDAFSWKPNTIEQISDRRAGVSIWMRGLRDNADRNNVQAFLGDMELSVEAVAQKQVNAMLTEALPEGEYSLTVVAGGQTSPPFTIEIGGA